MLPREVRAIFWQKLRLLFSTEALRVHIDHKARPRFRGDNISVLIRINDKRVLAIHEFQQNTILYMTSRTDSERVRVSLFLLGTSSHVFVHLDYCTLDHSRLCNRYR